MTYRLPTDTERAVNRDRCMILYAHLRGCYQKFCEAYRRVKGTSGRYEYASKLDKVAWDRTYIPEIESLCGKWYTEGINADALPHPVQVAIQLRNGRDIRQAMAMLGKEDFIDKVRARCAALGIRI